MAETILRPTDASCRAAAGQVIDEDDHPVVRRLADVLRSRSRGPRVFVIDDRENIQQAVRCGIQLDSLYLTAGTDSAGTHDDDVVAPPDVTRHVLSAPVTRKLFGADKLARTFALARSPRPATLDDLARSGHDIVVLEGVRLVGNIGAITRSASALGAAGLVLIDSGLTTVLDRRLVRSSRALVFAIPVVLADRRQFISFARRQHLAIATLTAAAPLPLEAIRAVPDRLAMVLGGERGGVSAELDALARLRYAIRMTTNVESLNVSVAAGIALYEHRRR